jgi:3-oxoadipate enol-lactonase
MWDAVAEELALDQPVLRYDHRGHGGSGGGAGDFTLHDLVEDAARVIREWGRGPVAFVGLSLGGMVGQGLAISYPECVSRLFLANTTSAYPPPAQQAWASRIQLVEQGGMSAVADMVLQRYLHAEFRAAHPDVVERMRNGLLRQDAAAYSRACAAVAQVNWTEQLHRIKCPTQVLAGARDEGATLEMARELTERIPGARLSVLENASHLSVAECPGEFVDLLRIWMRVSAD